MQNGIKGLLSSVGCKKIPKPRHCGMWATFCSLVVLLWIEGTSGCCQAPPEQSLSWPWALIQGHPNLFPLSFICRDLCCKHQRLPVWELAGEGPLMQSILFRAGASRKKKKKKLPQVGAAELNRTKISSPEWRCISPMKERRRQQLLGIAWKALPFHYQGLIF